MDIYVEGYTIRKWIEFFEEACSNELGISADGLPVAKFGVGVVIQNPYAGKFSKDLSLLNRSLCSTISCRIKFNLFSSPISGHF